MNKIRKLRILKGWTQLDLALKAGTSQSAISQLENYKRESFYSTRKRVAHALGVKVEDLENE